jgi:hypothetical protein
VSCSSWLWRGFLRGPDAQGRSIGNCTICAGVNDHCAGHQTAVRACARSTMNHHIHRQHMLHLRSSAPLPDMQHRWMRRALSLKHLMSDKLRMNHLRLTPRVAAAILKFRTAGGRTPPDGKYVRPTIRGNHAELRIAGVFPRAKCFVQTDLEVWAIRWTYRSSACTRCSMCNQALTCHGAVRQCVKTLPNPKKEHCRRPATALGWIVYADSARNRSARTWMHKLAFASVTATRVVW